jgi:hypothetical protein
MIIHLQISSWMQILSSFGTYYFPLLEITWSSTTEKETIIFLNSTFFHNGTTRLTVQNLESDTLSCYINPNGNFTLLSVGPSSAWIVDSSATDHMICDSTLFSSYNPCAGNHKIKVVDDSFSAIASKGSVELSPSLTIRDILHVPN